MDLEGIFERYRLPVDEYEGLKDHFELRRLRSGETVFEEGDASDTFFFVHSGELAVSRLSGGRQERVLKVLGPGEFFGEIGLLNDVRRTASVRAVSDAQLYALDRDQFLDLRKRNAAFARLLDEIHVQRLLHGVPLFGDLDDHALARIRLALEPREAPAGEVLARQGAPVTELVLVLKGSAREYCTAPDGHERPTGRLYPGAYLGEQGLLARARHPCSVELDTPARLLTLSRERLRELLRHCPSISFKLPGSGLLTRVLPFFYNKQAYLKVPELAMGHPRTVVWAMGLITLLLTATAIAPSLWPNAFPFLHGLVVDTDPENMLAADEPARTYHERMKAEMTLHDMLVVGVVEEGHPQGVFNVATLGRVHALTEYARGLRWPDPERPGHSEGVVAVDILAPSTLDVVEQGDPGTVRFSWLMPVPPRTPAEARRVYERLKRFPTLDGTLISADGKALSLYLPLTSKDVSFKVYQALQQRIAELGGDEQYLITGLPVAEDAFGVEMFYQMAISAPLAMLVIFGLMYAFFHHLILVVSPMVVAMVAVLCTMALLVMSGNTLHIMSSMIPIFIMPIAVLDSVHILSEFFDSYPRLRDRRLTMEHVMRELFAPMLFTSLTTAVGFASLALVPIPPVQVFGVFVAVGVLLAWLLSIAFIPAYVLLIPERRLAALGVASEGDAQGRLGAALAETLRRLRGLTLTRARAVLVVTLVLAVACLAGVTRIVVNDNPVRWFAPGHPIRTADRVLNRHFAGTYMAYLALEAAGAPEGFRPPWLATLRARPADLRGEGAGHDAVAAELLAKAERTAARDGAGALERLRSWVEGRIDAASEGDAGAWEAAAELLDGLEGPVQPFKDPAVLAYIERLQEVLAATGIVGKSVSVADLVKTINRELRGGSDEGYRVPGSAQGVAQTLLTYQSGHRPQDLWRFVSPDYRKASIWLLLNSGDNQEMSRVVEAVEGYMAAHPPPVAMRHGWFGLTYINVVWQEKMVWGMLFSIAGSFLMVLLMMVFLLRSTLWGLLAMAPLSATLMVIYGVLGLAGRPYDMPVAVLSALTVGLAVDFTIHFLVRTRHFMSLTGDWGRTLKLMYEEPARAITRNILVVAIGFLPLLAAPLVPYNTVGTLIAAILLTSGVATLLLMPAALQRGQTFFFPRADEFRTTVFRCRDAYFAAGVAMGLVLLAGRSAWGAGWEALAWLAAGLVVPGLAAYWGCCALRRSAPSAARRPERALEVEG